MKFEQKVMKKLLPKPKPEDADVEYIDLDELLEINKVDVGYGVFYRTGGDFKGKALYVTHDVEPIIGRDSDGAQIIVFRKRKS